MAEAAHPNPDLPLRGRGFTGTAAWGMLCLIATEGILFAYLIFSFLYLGTQTNARWPDDGPPALTRALPNTILLLASSLVLEWSKRNFLAGRSRRWQIGLAATILMGAGFVYVQVQEWAAKSFGPTTDTYGSAYFTLTGIHMAHVVLGLVGLGFVFVWSAQGRLSHKRHEHLSIATIYWHFVDVVWLCVFTTVYLAPRIG